MADTAVLVLDLVEWVAIRPRPYVVVMDAWRTSCPRLTIWEDAVDQGLVRCEREAGLGTVVKATPLGLSLLRREGRLPSRSPSSTAGAAAPS
jgi:hypothetical protein